MKLAWTNPKHLGHIQLGPVTRTDFVRYAGASGDFNPLHHDAEFARAAGLPDVMAQGMYSAGLLASVLETWFGAGSLLRYSVRFRQPVWPDDRLTARCDSLTETTATTADLCASLCRGKTDVVLTATATIRKNPAGQEA